LFCKLQPGISRSSSYDLPHPTDDLSYVISFLSRHPVSHTCSERSGQVFNTPVYCSGHSCLLFWTLLFTVLDTPVYCSGHSCLLFWTLLFTVLDTPVYCSGHSCLLFWTLLFTVLDTPVYYSGHSCLLFWTLLFTILEVPDTNIGPDTGYPD